jgi:NADH dehydrogenase/NADH:ubiquinone oxidoreductase subunit G
VAEKLGRLKLNGRLRGYSPLSRLLELEGLLIGITGKIALWKTLEALDDVKGLEIDFEQLAARAAEQRSAVEDLHRLAGSSSF